MSAPPPDHLTDKEVESDLKAAVWARRELGGELEDHVLESFLARMEERIDARVDQSLTHRGSRPLERENSSAEAKTQGERGGGAGGHKFNPTEFAAVSVGTAIPLTVAAGFFAHTLGVMVVLIGAFLLNLAYILGEQNRR